VACLSGRVSRKRNGASEHTEHGIPEHRSTGTREPAAREEGSSAGGWTSEGALLFSVAWIAHFYTGLGAGAALAATLAVFDDDFKAAFLWLALQVFIDTTDGMLARRLRVKERLPFFDGARLDDIIDYLTYVFVPVLLMLRANVLPQAWGVWVGLVVLLASAYGFSRTDAKVSTTDFFFTGFPSYWNIVAVYLYVWKLPPPVAAAAVLAFAALVFVPIRYVYPSRTVTLRWLTLTLGTTWAALMLVVIWRLPATDGPWAALSIVFPIYYMILSLWLSRTGGRSG
jgi:phosphatidylcholine synthase